MFTKLVTDVQKVIKAKGLKTCFYMESHLVWPVDGVDFSIGVERTLGMVGESG